MIRQRPRGNPLTVELLEDREVPALVDIGQLAIDPSTYDPSHVLVKWNDGLGHATYGLGKQHLGNGLYRVNLPPTVSVAQAVTTLEARSDVAFAQPDYRLHVARVPNDPSFTSLWGLNNGGQNGGTAGADIGAPEAWNTSTGNGHTVVAVIDSGVAYNHPDLQANMWRNPGEVPGNGIDDDRNGYKDDVFGYDFANNDSNPMDDNGHGTHVAGTIGAIGDNGVGIAGINWHTKIMALKFLDSSGSGYLSNALRALNYAVANGARVVNNSYGGGGFDSAMANAINNARSRGVIVVAAAGNDGTNNDNSPVYPANYPGDNLISVAATDRNDRLATFSNYGRSTVDIAAPGVSIYSTLPGNRYGSYSGTSMATPHVAGALALVWDAHPTWTYRQVIDAVLNTAERVSSLTDKVATGRLNVQNAITYSSTSTTPTPTPTPTPNPTPSPTPTPTAVTKTFASTTARAIQDYTRVVSSIVVNQDVTIRDLNVQVNATHTYASDVRMTLVGPDGTRVSLVNRRGGGGDNFTSTTFDDEAGQGIWQGAAPFAGSYRPEYNLGAFDGKNARGTWYLVVEDVALYDSGRLNGWSIKIEGNTTAAARSTPATAPPQNLPSAPPVSRSGRIEWGAFVPFFVS